MRESDFKPKLIYWNWNKTDLYVLKTQKFDYSLNCMKWIITFELEWIFKHFYIMFQIQSVYSTCKISTQSTISIFPFFFISI